MSWGLTCGTPTSTYGGCARRLRLQFPVASRLIWRCYGMGRRRGSLIVASAAVIAVHDQIGGDLSMSVKSPSHLITGVSGILAYCDVVSAARTFPGPQQRSAHVLLTGIGQDQRRLDGHITPVVPDTYHQWIRVLVLIHFGIGEPQLLQDDVESTSGLCHESLHPYVHPSRVAHDVDHDVRMGHWTCGTPWQSVPWFRLVEGSDRSSGVDSRDLHPPPWAAAARLCLRRRWSGWEPTTLTTIRPALANGAPSIPETECPRRKHVLPADDFRVSACRLQPAALTCLQRGSRPGAAPVPPAPRPAPRRQLRFRLAQSDRRSG